MLSPRERVEIWADFRGVPLGQVVSLHSQEFNPGWSGGAAPLPQGYFCHLMDFRVAQSLQDNRTLPTILSKIDPYRLEDATNKNDPRVIPISRVGTEWRLNGAGYGLYDLAPNEIVPRGEVQVWEFRNDSGMNLMAHPMHLHGAPFQILDRTTLPAFQQYYDTVKLGLIDEGWKDTFLIMPGQRARILTKFPNFTGRYLYHCHNLEHEDMGMMRNFDVV
jgi:FtsP/CotA-like multicopper oxidase with cupredoxin domain